MIWDKAGVNSSFFDVKPILHIFFISLERPSNAAPNNVGAFKIFDIVYDHDPNESGLLKYE